MDSPVPNDWTARLAYVVAESLREFSAGIVPFAAFDLGCFPWHGRLELSALTVREVEADQGLLEPGEAAAWKHYNFAEDLPPWRIATSLGREMQEIYGATEDVARESTVAAFLRACAAAVGSPQLASVLRESPLVRFTVCHPDTGESFCPPDRR